MRYHLEEDVDSAPNLEITHLPEGGGGASWKTAPEFLIKNGGGRRGGGGREVATGSAKETRFCWREPDNL
jgi:hypothetical protein